MNYGTGVKGLSYFLNNYCNVSIDKTRECLTGLTDGAVDVSAGMINNLARRLDKAPYVCNGCPDQRHCTLTGKNLLDDEVIYLAEVYQKYMQLNSNAKRMDT